MQLSGLTIEHSKRQSSYRKNLTSNPLTEITGQVSIVPTWPASKILWIKRNEPEIFRKTFKYLLVEDYLIYKMTGKFVAEGSLLCSTVYWDISKRKWWSEMLDRLEITPDQLPEIRESGEVVAELTPSVAAELGLSPKTIVSTGALDQAAGATGVGNIRPGTFSENTGAALAICAPLAAPLFDPREECQFIISLNLVPTWLTRSQQAAWSSNGSETISVSKKCRLQQHLELTLTIY